MPSLPAMFPLLTFLNVLVASPQTLLTGTDWGNDSSAGARDNRICSVPSSPRSMSRADLPSSFECPMNLQLASDDLSAPGSPQVILLIHDSHLLGRRIAVESYYNRSLTPLFGEGARSGATVAIRWFGSRRSDAPIAVATKRGTDDFEVSAAAFVQAKRDFPHARWFIKVDDDAVIFMSHMLKVLMGIEGDHSQACGLDYGPTFYGGFTMTYTLPTGESMAYASGGAGYVVSRGALLAMEGCLGRPGLTLYEDVNVGHCAAEAGLKVARITGMWPYTQEAALCALHFRHTPSAMHAACGFSMDANIMALDPKTLAPITRHYLVPAQIENLGRFSNSVPLVSKRSLSDFALYAELHSSAMIFFQGGKFIPYMFGGQPKMLLYSPSPESSLRSRLVGLVNSFALALVTGRAFKVDWNADFRLPLDPVRRNGIGNASALRDILQPPHFLMEDWDSPVTSADVSTWDIPHKRRIAVLTQEKLERGNLNSVREELLLVREPKMYSSALRAIASNSFYAGRIASAFPKHCALQSIAQWLLVPKPKAQADFTDAVGIPSVFRGRCTSLSHDMDSGIDSEQEAIGSCDHATRTERTLCGDGKGTKFMAAYITSKHELGSTKAVSATNRQMRMLEQAEKEGIKVHRVFAVPKSSSCIRRFFDANRPKKGWSCWGMVDAHGTLSLMTTNLDIFRELSACTQTEASPEWLLLLEDDAVFPEGVALLELLDSIASHHPDASVIWLDSRSGSYSASDPGGCCTSAMLYRVSFLPTLVAHLDFDNPASWGNNLTAARSSQQQECASDLVLNLLMTHEFPGQSAIVPVFGTGAFASLLKKDARTSVCSWQARRQSWPNWLLDSAPTATGDSVVTTTEKHDAHRPRNVVFHEMMGRLGNELFQWASVSGIAAKNKRAACFFATQELYTVFVGIPSACRSDDPFPREEYHVSESARFATHLNFQLDVRGSVLLSGYLQSFRYFPPGIRSQLRFKSEILAQANATFLGLASSQAKVRVGIHVRQTHQLEVSYLRFPPPLYFDEAMAHFRNKHSGVRFVVASDNPSWCLDQPYFQVADVEVVRTSSSAAVDLAVMASCDHMILSVGTFGWWGAFLGADLKGGEVVYYLDEFVQNHTEILGRVVANDYYPERWLGLGNKTAWENPSLLFRPIASTKVTIVTAYYELPSKHSSTEYDGWILNTMSLKDAMVIFTAPGMEAKFKSLRAHALNRTVVVSQPLESTRMATAYDAVFWDHQFSKDPEKDNHKSVRVYWVWNEKTQWLKQAADMDPFQSEFFAWVDVGYFRNDHFNGKSMIQYLPTSLRKDQVLMLDVSSISFGETVVGGGFIGGFRAGIRRWHVQYYSVLERNKEFFIGKDQPWMMEACTTSPGLCDLVTPHGAHGDQWFFMAPLLHYGHLVDQASVVTLKDARHPVKKKNTALRTALNKNRPPATKNRGKGGCLDPPHPSPNFQGDTCRICIKVT